MSAQPAGITGLRRANRATLLASGSIEIDKFTIFELPIPQEMLDADGDKTIGVALAFDPPVRRRRADYLGVSMSFDLIRGKKLAEVIDAYRAAESGEIPDKAVSGSSRITFVPSATRRNSSTLQNGSFTFKTLRKDYGKSYWLVVRAQRRWAPDTVTHQDVSVVTTLRCRSTELYSAIRDRVQVRLRQQQEQRQRARP